MVGRLRIPDAGNLFRLSLSPQSGKEQAGRRPVLIVSPKAYNQRSGLCIACPITTRIKGYPLEVVLPPSDDIVGAVLCDQVRSVDWQSRRAKFAGHAPADVLQEVRAKLKSLLGL